jgi:hypothetical protein
MLSSSISVSALTRAQVCRELALVPSPEIFPHEQDGFLARVIELLLVGTAHDELGARSVLRRK